MDVYWIGVQYASKASFINSKVKLNTISSLRDVLDKLDQQLSVLDNSIYN